ncbi:MAG: 3-phosphoshikimate 1-carboxyvinyltransferase [Actinomycetota bacterium]
MSPDPRALPDPFAIDPLDGPPDADVVLPGSKSITNRALVCAALAEGRSTLRGALFADDTEAMLGVLAGLGVSAEADPDTATIVVDGCGGELPGVEAEVSANQSGTTARFAVPLAALGEAPVVVDAHPQMRDRPMDDQFAALRSMGVTVDELGARGRLPARITGPVRSHAAALAGDVSSQFITGLLLAGGADHLRVALTTEPISRPYIEMTTAVMEAFGAQVDHDDGRVWSVGGGYRGTEYRVEPDASAASYFLAAAAITGGRVRVLGLGRDALQGDVAFAAVLGRMGCEIVLGDDFVEVSGRAHRGIDVDLSDISDTAPTLAVVAAFADSPTRVDGIGFIREKESDRVAAPVAELQRAGVEAEEFDDGFIVRPSGHPRPATFDTYDDHRMAMALSLVGLVVPGVSVRDPGCVAKTFPGYFAALEQLR